MPSEEIIIADSSPLIGLARIDQLGLLPQLARRIGVPRAVWAEVTSARTDAPGASEVAAQTWIEVLEADWQVVAPLLIMVGQGEAEAIALAQRESSSNENAQQCAAEGCRLHRIRDRRIRWSKS